MAMEVESSEAKEIQFSLRSSVPTFGHDEVKVGELIASGGYSSVFALRSIELLEESDSRLQSHTQGLVSIEKQLKARKELMDKLGSSWCSHEDRCVVKFLRPYLDSERQKRGAIDLYKEAKMLANLQHDNIIKLRGIAYRMGGGGDAPMIINNGIYLILDRMEETLLQRIVHWKKANKRNSFTKLLLPGITRRISRIKDTTATVQQPQKSPFQERLQVVVDLAAPLVYLHSPSINVVYRDLKPENVGFSCATGRLTLFDFGSARELRESHRINSSNNSNNNSTLLYRSHSWAGSHPYISPEMAKGEAYGLSSDTYSFAIVAFEILEMTEPFYKLMETEYIDQVIHGTTRPKLPKRTWPKDLQGWMTQCWDPVPTQRPTMEAVQLGLQAILLAPLPR